MPLPTLCTRKHCTTAALRKDYHKPQPVFLLADQARMLGKPDAKLNVRKQSMISECKQQTMLLGDRQSSGIQFSITKTLHWVPSCPSGDFPPHIRHHGRRPGSVVHDYKYSFPIQYQFPWKTQTGGMATVLVVLLVLTHSVQYCKPFPSHMDIKPAQP